ncbi:MAG TPA: membrane dipeptidase, partial [Povalibacter sp.]
MNLARLCAVPCVLLACIPLVAAAAGEKSDAASVHARELLHKVILIDGHNDLPWAIRTDKQATGRLELYDLRSKVAGQTDIARLRQGGIGGQFWSVYTPGEAPDHFARTQLEQIDLARRMIQRYPETFAAALTAADIRAAHKVHRIASLLGIEGGHAIENSLGALRA